MSWPPTISSTAPWPGRIALALLIPILLGACAAGRPEPVRELIVTIPPAAAATTAVPAARPGLLGAGVDGHGLGETAQIYTPHNIRMMLSAGLTPLAYRLRTELGQEAWHWNPIGSFSDLRCRCGYWVSSSRPGKRRIAVSYGYRLPRRGDTIDQANNDGYSRIDDGSAATFWKSNPYLDPRFTDEPHPQWVMIDLGRARPIDAIRLDWAQPYATRFVVQRWVGSTPPARYGAERENAVFATGPAIGRWVAFPRGHVARARGRRELLRLGARPIGARYLRVLMLQGSGTAPKESRDPRDRLGFALAELAAGRVRSSGAFEDFVGHGRSNTTQSVIWVSSTDPWHRARDLDTATEQPGFDTVFASGLARRAPVLMAVATAYGVPQDAAAELLWLHRRGYPVGRVELGEEPDGQLIGPEDYGALYAEFAAAIRRIAPRLTLGGPGFSSAVPDWNVWPDGHASTSWTGRFIAELRARHALAQLGFFSFEWYPFDDVCAPSAPQLASQPALLRRVLARQYAAGLPRAVPLLLTEYGYSAFAAQAEVARVGGLFDADIAASFLAAGGSTAYLYGYEPDQPIRESVHCSTYGNLALLASDSTHRARQPLAAYWAMRLLTGTWLTGAGETVVAASTGTPTVAAYAAEGAGPGRTLGLLLINKDPRRSRTIRVTRGGRDLRGPGDLYSFGPAQYVWHPRGSDGYASPDAPPVHTRVASGAIRVRLAPYSIVVLRTGCATRCG